MIDTITIMSCNRTPSFLDETLLYIPQQYNIEIFYQSSSIPEKYSNLNIIKVDYFQDSSQVYPNSQFNYANCLLNTKNGFIIEDDVLFSKNFVEYFEILKSYIQSLNCKYAIAVYSCYDWNQYDIRLMDYQIDGFYGTQAMIYDLETARSFGNYLMSRIGVEPYDLALKSYIKEVDPSVKLLAVSRSLVQHIGHKTSGLGFFHQAGNFVDGP